MFQRETVSWSLWIPVVSCVDVSIQVVLVLCQCSACQSHEQLFPRNVLSFTCAMFSVPG